MPKPGRSEPKPSSEIAKFTDRKDKLDVFRQWVSSATEPPVLMFYGVGGTGKSWLLKKLREETPQDLPFAFLDFDGPSGGQRFINESAAGLYEIRQQLGQAAPRFELAFAMMRHKQGAAEEPGLKGGLAFELAAELAQAVSFVPGVGVVIRELRKPLRARLKGSSIERLLIGEEGQRFVSDLRRQTSQEISNELLVHLAADLRESLPCHLHRAVRAVLFFDTFEALGTGLANSEQRRGREQWVQGVATNFDFALTVIAGQNRLTWEEADPACADNLEQHLVGGLSEGDSRRFLGKWEIDDPELQDAILTTARETDGCGYHCYSLGLCADVVLLERQAGRTTAAATLRLRPGDSEALARRFLKSLKSDQQRRWIVRLALTPRFDEVAARAAFSDERSAAQDVEWKTLHAYSFVQKLENLQGDWHAMRGEMRSALEKQPAEQVRVREDHEWWREHWQSRSQSAVDDAASLAWYHWHCVEPAAALDEWIVMADGARTSVPPRMHEHFGLLHWWDPVGLLEPPPSSPEAAHACHSLGSELFQASLGDRSENLHRAIACHEAALRVRTEQVFPQEWGITQNNLGNAWSNLPTGDRESNLRQAIACYEAALRVRTDQEFPQEWGITQNNLGNAWSDLLTGDRESNLRQAMTYYEAALRVRTEQGFPQKWAMTQHNLGHAWSNLSTGDRESNLRQAIACYEVALRVCPEQDFPQKWAMTQNNLGDAWSDLPTDDRESNLHRAIACYEAALRVYTEQDFPQDWAMTQNNLGHALFDLPTDDRESNLHRAIACYEAALRVRTEKDFPQEWAGTQYDLGKAWSDLPTGDRESNLRQAIACHEAALRVYTEQDFPLEWAGTQYNLGLAWFDLPTDDRGSNLRQAIACNEAALRVYTEQDFPQIWAMTQNILGDAWFDLPTDDRGSNLHQAIACYEAALRVYTEQNFPQKYEEVRASLRIAREAIEHVQR
jgi:tetratricopeptide (TPR) repeat protein